MQTLTEENRELRIKIANLEQALGRTFELSQKLPEARLAAGRCAEILPGLTVSNPPEAIDWYGEVLGAKEVFRVEDKDGQIAHAALRIGDSVLTINGEYPDVGKISPEKLGAKKGANSVALTVFVDDAKATFAKALKTGSKEVSGLKEAFWGDLTGTIVDPFGHHWNVSTNVEPLSAREIVRRAEKEFKAEG